MKIVVCQSDEEFANALIAEGATPAPLPEGTWTELTKTRQETVRFVLPYRLTDDDIRALRTAYTSRDEEDAAIMAPDADTEQYARTLYRRGTELKQVYTSWMSPDFPAGADPDGARLEAFKQRYNIVAWIAIDAGYIATALQRCYVGVGIRKP